MRVKLTTEELKERARARSRAYYQLHREAMLARESARRLARNPDVILRPRLSTEERLARQKARQAEYYLKHQERLKQSASEYYQKTRELRMAARRLYYERKKAATA